MSKDTKVNMNKLCILIALVFTLGLTLGSLVKFQPTMYRVLQAGGYEQMEYEVNAWICDGWSIAGELQVTAYPDPTSQSGIGVQIIQVITK